MSQPKSKQQAPENQPVFWSPAPALRKYPGYLFWKLQCQLVKSEFHLHRPSLPKSQNRS